METNTSDFDEEGGTDRYQKNKKGMTEDPVVAAMTAQYARTIKENRELFGYDPGLGVDTAEEYMEAFRKQPYDIQLTWLASLNAEMEGLRQLQEEFMLISPEDIAIFSGLRRHQKRELVKTLKVQNVNLENDFRTKLFKSSNSKHFCKKTIK